MGGPDCAGLEPLPEDLLHQMGKSISLRFQNMDFDDAERKNIEWLHHHLSSLFHTAWYPGISPTHRTAACNVLSGTIEQCLVDKNPRVVALVCSDDFGVKLLDLYLYRYDGATAKCMKQILSSLVRLLSKGSALSLTSDALFSCVDAFLAIIFENKARPKAKAALQGLTHFLCRDLLLANVLIERVELTVSRLSAITHCYSNWNRVQLFILGVLEWISCTEVAPAAGKFLSAFLEKCPVDSLSVLEEVGDSNALPVWCLPLMQSIRKHPDDVNAFKIHAFPALFKLSPQSYWQFLMFLGVQNQLGKGEPYSETLDNDDEIFETNIRIPVLFLALQEGRKMGLVKVTVRYDSSVVYNEDDITYITNAALSCLLQSASRAVRLAGLTILVMSTHTTTPYTPQILNQLRYALPMAYADTDAKFRGEIQSLVSGFVNRFRAVVATLHKTCRRQMNHHPASLDEGETVGADSGNDPAAAEALALLETHQNFLRWFLSFLIFELHPAASYQRHISALKSLKIIMTSGLDGTVLEQNLSKQARTADTRWPFQIAVADLKSRRAMLDLLLNPFEDVRHAALELLQLTDGQVQHEYVTDWFPTVASAIRRARIVMTRSGRMDHADGVGLLYDLVSYKTLCHPQEYPLHLDASMDRLVHSVTEIVEHLLSYLERAIQVAEDQLSKAVSDYPVHGYIISLRYVIQHLCDNPHALKSHAEELARLFEVLQGTFARLWKCVCTVLCNDAPEGFLPEDMDEDAELTTKDVSSYAWRALKESSLLLRTITHPNILRHLYGDPERTRAILETSGDLCFEQLAELRHRGAFTTVAQTFASICQRCATFKGAEVEDLLEKWYQRTLFLIREKGAVTTRRSAGIPALLLGIVVANPTHGTFERAITDLQFIAEQTHPTTVLSGSELPQVHALNSLKVMITHPSLAEQAQLQIVQLMNVASDCLAAKIWAIRNSGLMLFRGLMDRLLATNETSDPARHQSASQLSYRNYPGLLELIIQVLNAVQPAVKSSEPTSVTNEDRELSMEAVFPILDLLRRSPPDAQEWDRLSTLVLQTTGSSHWHVRDIAARTIAKNTPKDNVVTTISTLLSSMSIRTNESHGVALVIQYLVKVYSEELKNGLRPVDRSDFVALIAKIEKTFLHDVGVNIKAIYLQSLNELGGAIIGYHSWHAADRSTLFAVVKSFLDASRVSTAAQFQPSALLDQAIQLNMWLAYLLKQRYHYAMIANVENFDDVESQIGKGPSGLSAQRDVLEKLKVILKSSDDNVRRVFAQSLASILLHCCDDSTCETGESVLVEVVHLPTALRSWDMFSELWKYMADQKIGNRFFSKNLQFSTTNSIRIWGITLLTKWWNHKDDDWALEEETKQWIRVVRSTIGEEYDLRFAAIESMNSFSYLFVLNQSLPSHLRVAFALAVSDALVDDEEDVRDLAARVTVRIVTGGTLQSTSELGWAPLVACQKLCSYLVKDHGNSPQLFTYSLGKVIEHGAEHLFSCVVPTVDCVLSDMDLKDGILFTVEKQNLYVDEVAESRRWSRVLMQLPVETASEQLAARYAEWVKEGLLGVVDIAAREVDGPLGWSSRPEAFIFGMRLIYSAEVLLDWQARSPMRKTWGSTVRQTLRELADAARYNTLHACWCSEIDRILGQSIDTRVVEARSTSLGEL